MTLEERAAAHISTAIAQLMKCGVTRSEATVLIDYYLEHSVPENRIGVESFSHEQAPILWKNLTAGTRGRCVLLNYGDTNAEYVWGFRNNTTSLYVVVIPNTQTNQLFASIEKNEPAVDPMNIPIGYRRDFHLNQVVSPEFLQKWKDFQVWLIQYQRRASPQ